MPRTLRIAAPLLALLSASCLQTAVTRETLRPIPEHPPRADQPASVRGTEQAARRLPEAQQLEIVGQVVRVFYRPLMSQARWIDPRPLAHARTRLADSAAVPDPDWAIAIAQASGLRRVCPLDEANAQCQGRDGGILRFSRAYAVGAGMRDSALVYVQYTPRSYGVASEIEFFMTRRDSLWQITSRRSLPMEKAEGALSSEVVDTRRAAEELLAADRAFAQAAARTDLVSAISNMFLSNVVMRAPTGHARGKDAAIAALSADSANRRSRVEWTPVGGGTSSGGQDGFTYGYMTVTRPDGTVRLGKYLAYWVLRPGGWRVAVYNRTTRAPGDVSQAPHPLSIATRALPSGDSTALKRYADELSLAEHTFSRDAQSMGLGPAFAKWGAADAVNTGGGASAEFVRGPEAIARLVSAAYTPETKVEWAPTEVIVASTGDMGVTIGTIRITTTETREVPFFTIWKRAYPSDPWRYVAE
jgi:hypothetical protein